jgi:hypothetical protein
MVLHRPFELAGLIAMNSGVARLLGSLQIRVSALDGVQTPDCRAGGLHG